MRKIRWACLLLFLALLPAAVALHEAKKKLFKGGQGKGPLFGGSFVYIGD
jgi:hypothetical protein